MTDEWIRMPTGKGRIQGITRSGIYRGAARDVPAGQRIVLRKLGRGTLVNIPSVIRFIEAQPEALIVYSRKHGSKPQSRA